MRPAIARAQSAFQTAGVRVNDSPAAEHLIDQAEHQISLEQYSEAAAIFQRVATEYGRKLLQQGDGLYIDASRWVEDRLLRDDRLLQTYRQLNEIAAGRALEQAVTPKPTIEGLESVRRAYALCEAGLTATLDEAALYLERACPDEAALLLADVADHPDIARHVSRWTLLQGGVALLRGDELAMQRQRQALEKLNDTQSIKTLAQWAAQWSPPKAAVVYDPTHPLPLSDSVQPIGKPFWVYKLSPLKIPGRHLRPPVVPQRFRNLQRGGGVGGEDDADVIPVARGDKLFLNEKLSVTALDRVSGRPLWTYRLDHETTPRMPSNRGYLPYMAFVTDQRGVALDGDHVLAVMGLSRIMTRGIPVRGQIDWAVLTCLDQESGRRLWQRSAEELDPEMAGASFLGTPLVSGGRILALLFRQQTSNFHDIHVIALRGSDGSLLWRRHLLSTPVSSRMPVPMIPEMSMTHGRLYVTDGNSAVAALTAHDGIVQWIRLLDGASQLDLSMLARAAPSPGSPPVALGAGLLVKRMTSQPPAMLLNPETGAIAKELTGEPWNQPGYLLSAGDNALLVGPTVALVSGDDPQKVLWSRDFSKNGDAVSGRAAVTRDRVFLTVNDQLLQLNLADGKTLESDQVEEPGNLLVMDGQLVIASEEQLVSHMAWPWAQLQLLREMKRHPEDPLPGLGLAQAALVASKPESIIKGIDHALAALEQRPPRPPDEPTDPLQQEVFDQILWLTRLPVSGDNSDARRNLEPATRRELLDRLALAATGPRQQVVYQLGMGEFLTRAGELEKAVDFYQSVLDSPEMGAQLYEQEHGHSLLAELEARMRLAELIGRGGKKIYARYAALAQEKLARLLAQPARDPHALAGLADRYPLADCAAAARVGAADAFASQSNPSAAIAQLHHAYRTAAKAQPVHRDMMTDIISRLVSLYEQQGQPTRAKGWLRTAMRDFPDLTLKREGQPISMKAWMAELDERAVAVERLPQLNLPLRTPYAVRGRLLVPLIQRDQEMVRDHIMTLDGRTLQYRGGERLEVIWEYPLDDPAVELVALNDEQALLWLAGEGELLAFDVHTGKLAWPAVSALALLPDAGQANGNRNLVGRGGNVRIIDPQRGLVLLQQRVVLGGIAGAAGDSGQGRPVIQINDQVICLVDRPSRRVIAIDRDRGEVLWRKDFSTIDNLYFVDLAHQTLVLGGLVDTNNNATKGTRIIAVNAVKGEPIGDAIDDDSMLLWLGLSDADTLVYATRTDLQAISIPTRQMKWRQALDDLDFGGMVFQDNHRLLVRARTGSVFGVDLDTGKLNPPVTVPGLMLSDTLNAVATEDAWHVTTAEQALALDPAGQLLWRDAIFDPDKNLLTQLVGKQHVLLVDRGNELEPADENTYHLFVLNRASGVIVDEYTIGPLSQPLVPTTAMLLDNRVILGTSDATIIIPDSTAAD